MTLSTDDALGLLASCVFLARLLPQPIRLARTGVASGVSPLAALNSMLTMVAWVSYGLIVGLPLVWVVSVIALVPGIWTVLLLRRDVSRRDLSWAGGWLALQVVAALCGLLVGVLAVGVLVTQGPQVLRALRESDLRGLSASTWWLSIVDAATWGAYGLAVGDPALVGYGLVLSTSAIIVLTRIHMTRQRGRRGRRRDLTATVPAMDDDVVLIAGSASRRLGQAIADYLDHPLGACETLRFSDGNVFVRVLENVRGRDVFLVQGTSRPANDNFMELLFWVDALKRASAASVTVVMPYFSYAKGDKKDEPRVSIRARVCADAIEVSGADRVLTMDLHAAQLQGFFRIPVDDLYALPVLCDAIAAKHIEDLVVVSPDAGFAKKARLWADRLQVPLAIADKRRVDHSETAEVTELIGSVEGCQALIVDDFTISAGTLIDAARVLIERGAVSVHAAVTHGLLTSEASRRLDDSPIERLFMTDTIEAPADLSAKVEIVSVAGLFGEAIRRIADRESISKLFE